MSSPRRRIETDVSTTVFPNGDGNVANTNRQKGHEVRCRLSAFSLVVLLT